MNLSQETSDIKVLDLENICRICLSIAKEKINVFGSEFQLTQSNGLTYNIQIEELTQLEVQQHDLMPKHLCKACALELSKSCNFKTRIIQSDHYLKQFVENLSQVKKEIKPELDYGCLEVIKVPDKVESDSEVVYNNDEFLQVDDRSLSPDNKQNVLNDTKITKTENVCSECRMEFCDEKSMKAHMRYHVSKHCEKCDKSFLKESQFQRHMEKHANVHSCKYCDESFGTLKKYRTHLTEIHSKEIQKEKSEKKLTNQKTKKLVVKPIKRELLERSIICKICEENFKTVGQLKLHLMSHTDPASLTDIDFCTKLYLFDIGEIQTFDDTDMLIANIIKKIQQGNNDRFYQILSKDGSELTLSDSDSDDEQESLRQYVCSKCNQMFIRAKHITVHANEQHDLMTFPDKCEKCGKQFPCKVLLERHLQRQCENQTKGITCDQCSQKFFWLDSLEIHTQLYHDTDNAKRKYGCDTCGKTFSRSEHLDRHKRIHNPSEKKFECPECKKKFNRKDNLRSHMKIHEPDRQIKAQYLCNFCGRSFSNSSNLIVHTRRHTGDKPYKCDICNKGFPRSSDLHCHRRTHTGEKPFLCNTCGKKFSRSNKLVRHERIHKNIRPYACPYCDRSFTQSNDLTLHIRRHTGNKPFSCGVCNERFIQGTALKAHQRLHGHFEQNPDNPDQYTSVSVNNPNRIQNTKDSKRWKIEIDNNGEEPIVIRPVTRKRTVNNEKSSMSKKEKQVKTMPKKVVDLNVKKEMDSMEVTTSTVNEFLESSFAQLPVHSVTAAGSSAIIAPTANYGVTLLPNDTVLMAEMPPTTMLFQITPQ